MRKAISIKCQRKASQNHITPESRRILKNENHPPILQWVLTFPPETGPFSNGVLPDIEGSPKTGPPVELVF
jgi:hypothetical protein